MTNLTERPCSLALGDFFKRDNGVSLQVFLRSPQAQITSFSLNLKLSPLFTGIHGSKTRGQLGREPIVGHQSPLRPCTVYSTYSDGLL